jgi:Esterase-like activity of phytase
VRNNLAFESLTISPNQKSLYTATEEALFQDGATASDTTGTRSRIIKYNLATGQPTQEFIYVTDPIAKPANPVDGAKNNGLVDLLAIDNQGTLLALERSFSVGSGLTIKIYQVTLAGASDVQFIEALSSLSPRKLARLQPAQKKLLLNLDDLKLEKGLDNIEGLTFGPPLPDGRRLIVLVSDNNFSDRQFTQILAIGADLPSADPRSINMVPGKSSESQDLLSAGMNDDIFAGAGNDYITATQDSHKPSSRADLFASANDFLPRSFNTMTDFPARLDNFFSSGIGNNPQFTDLPLFPPAASMAIELGNQQLSMPLGLSSNSNSSKI